MSDAEQQTPAEEQLAELFARHERGETFRSAILVLDVALAEKFVRFRFNPPRFLKPIFDGNWAVPSDHPAPGPIRMVRIITGNDGISRAIGRQVSGLYATPWIN